jgi:hypothetical protein
MCNKKKYIILFIHFTHKTCYVSSQSRNIEYLTRFFSCPFIRRKRSHPKPSSSFNFFLFNNFPYYILFLTVLFLHCLLRTATLLYSSSSMCNSVITLIIIYHLYNCCCYYYYLFFLLIIIIIIKKK